MKTRRRVQYQHIRDTIKAVKQDLTALTFEQAMQLIAPRIPQDSTPERYTAMVLSVARQNTIADDMERFYEDL